MITKLKNSEGLNKFVLDLEAMLAEELKNFSNFLDKYSVTDWSILSDYCIGHKEYHNDALVFTVIPGNKYLLNPQEIKMALPKDLKDCRNKCKLENNAVNFLRAPVLFTFVFLLDPKENFMTHQQSHHIVKETLAMMKNWKNASENRDLIKRFEKLEKSIASQSLNLRLLNHTILSAFFAASITTFIAKRIRIAGICWIFDRDDIHHKWEGIAGFLFHANVHAFLLDQELPYIEKIGFKSNKSGDDFDMYTRIPDYFAGPLARRKLVEGFAVQSMHLKDKQLFEEVFAENTNLIVTKINFQITDRIKIIKFFGKDFLQKD